MPIIKLADIVHGHKMCCICFDFIPFDKLYVDSNGDKWDYCVPCAPKVWGSDATTTK